MFSLSPKLVPGMHESKLFEFRAVPASFYVLCYEVLNLLPWDRSPKQEQGSRRLGGACGLQPACVCVLAGWAVVGRNRTQVPSNERSLVASVGRYVDRCAHTCAWGHRVYIGRHAYCFLLFF